MEQAGGEQIIALRYLSAHVELTKALCLPHTKCATAAPFILDAFIAHLSARHPASGLLTKKPEHFHEESHS